MRASYINIANSEMRRANLGRKSSDSKSLHDLFSLDFSSESVCRFVLGNNTRRNRTVLIATEHGSIELSSSLLLSPLDFCLSSVSCESSCATCLEANSASTSDTLVVRRGTYPFRQEPALKPANLEFCLQYVLGNRSAGCPAGVQLVSQLAD